MNNVFLLSHYDLLFCFIPLSLVTCALCKERDSLPDFFSGEVGVCTQPISLVAKYEFYYFEIGLLPMGLLSHTLSNTNLVASRHIKREKGSLPVDVCRSETSLIKLPILFKRDEDFSLAKSTVRVSTSFSSLLLAARPYTVANCIQKSNNDHFDP